MRWIFLLPLFLILAACGGTDVGNALSSSVESTIEVNSANSQPPATTSLSRDTTKASSLADLNLTTAILHIKQISLRPSEDCSQKKANIKTWTRIPVDQNLNLLSEQGVSASLNLINGTSFCQVRIVVGPSFKSDIDLQGRSILIHGHNTKGVDFILESIQKHLLVLDLDSLKISKTDGANIEDVLYQGSIFDGLNLVNLNVGGNQLMSPVKNPTLFKLFLANLRKSFRGHRFSKTGPNKIRDRGHSVGSGNSSIEDEEPDEEN